MTKGHIRRRRRRRLCWQYQQFQPQNQMKHQRRHRQNRLFLRFRRDDYLFRPRHRQHTLRMPQK